MDRRVENTDFKTALSAIADLALPRVCVVCGTGLMPGEKHICLNCLADLPLTRYEDRSRNPMADRLNERIALNSTTVDKAERYAFATALFFYDSGGESKYGKICRELKYRRNFSCGRHFARMLGERMASSELFADVDAILPVPLHWTRKWKRGYNQAEVIASEIAAVLGVPCRTDVLRRIRMTRTQTGMEGEEKTVNVSGAFRAVMPGNEAYRHLLLVDDVFTSGSTTYECFSALRQVFGPEVRISVATLGFVNNF